MSTLVKYVVGHTYKPLLEKYLSRKRAYTYNGFRLEIPPEVFHPGFFTSTRFLMEYLSQFELKGKSVLELGAGSGLISLHAANAGAIVTATDLNGTAIEYLSINSQRNGVELKVIYSDLFNDVPPQSFDFIIINPPYYKKDAANERELAWCCGSKGEFFMRLFEGIGAYLYKESKVLMVLCDGCDLQMIERMAHKEGFVLDCVRRKRNLVEWNYIFSVRKKEEWTSKKSSQEKKEFDPFLDLYIHLRSKENRVYTDEELQQLPSISPSHPHAREWKAREESTRELLPYCKIRSKPLDVLEIGCGNGWLAHRISEVPGCDVTAIDINHIELEQAKRVFSRNANLKFVEGDIRKGLLKDKYFDVIVFAASIQYFENLVEILLLTADRLRKGGCIHIIDSHFYKPGQGQAARRRSREYFRKAGVPEMAAYYFHHSIKDLEGFNYRMVFDPKTNPYGDNGRVFPYIYIETYH